MNKLETKTLGYDHQHHHHAYLVLRDKRDLKIYADVLIYVYIRVCIYR